MGVQSKLPARGLVMNKLAKVLTTRGREQIKETNFALPGHRYPIHDSAHARNALARVAQHGSAEEQAVVRAKVHKKYPGIEQGTMEENRKDKIVKKAAALLSKTAMEDAAVRKGQGFMSLAQDLGGYKGGWRKLQSDVKALTGSGVLRPGQVFGYDDAGNLVQRGGSQVARGRDREVNLPDTTFVVKKPAAAAAVVQAPKASASGGPDKREESTAFMDDFNRRTAQERAAALEEGRKNRESRQALQQHFRKNPQQAAEMGVRIPPTRGGAEQPAKVESQVATPSVVKPPAAAPSAPAVVKAPGSGDLLGGAVVGKARTEAQAAQETAKREAARQALMGKPQGLLMRTFDAEKKSNPFLKETATGEQ